VLSAEGNKYNGFVRLSFAVQIETEFLREVLNKFIAGNLTVSRGKEFHTFVGQDRQKLLERSVGSVVFWAIVISLKFLDYSLAIQEISHNVLSQV